MLPHMIRINHPNGYFLMDYQAFMKNYNRTGRKPSGGISKLQVNRIMKLASQNGGWRVLEGSINNFYTVKIPKFGDLPTPPGQSVRRTNY